MMEEDLTVDSCEEMTKLQSSCSRIPDNSAIPTVTTAEASSAENTKTESPRQQPQAFTMTTDLPSASFSTVHVQQSPAFSGMRTLLLTHSASEPIPANPRKMLVRSTAVRSTSSPPLPPEDNIEVSIPHGMTNTSFDSCQSCDSGIASELPFRQDIQGRGSTQSSFSRDNSFEYTDSTGTDLHEFIVKTLKNPRDRKFVMKLEHDFLNFIQDPLTIYINYPPMTSYHRMIVHRVAAFFGMDHNVDQQTGKSVIINKSINTRIPEQRFADLVSSTREESDDSEGALPRSILRRQNTPSDESTPPKVESPVIVQGGMEDKRSKSIEEREEEYVKARQRIFNQEDSLSSQSSQSSKGDGDMPQPQILTREEVEFLQHEQFQETPPRIHKSRSLDNERTMEKYALPGAGVRIMSNKIFTRSSSSPGAGVAAALAAAERSRVTGSPMGSRPQVTGISIPASGMQYWSSEGVPMVASGIAAGEVQMVPTQGLSPGMQGMVPVMAGGVPSGGMMWAVPPETVHQGMMLINPNTGAPALGPDGNPIIVQPAYQQMMVKPGSSPRYAQPQQRQQQVTPQQPTAPIQQATAMGQQPGQVMMSQYVGMQQPVYVMQQPARAPYGQQQVGTEGVSPGHWPGNAQAVSSSYQEMNSQFTAMAIGGQQQELDPAMQQQMVGDESMASTTTTPPLYVASVSQSSVPGQPGQVHYVMLPHQGMHPQQQLCSVAPGQPLPSHMVMQQGSSIPQTQSYVVTAQPSYPQSPYQHQYNISKDISILSHARSQTPPTPPRTSSPLQAFNTQSIQMSSQSNPQQQSTQYQQQTPPQTPSQVLRPMVPVVLSGSRAVPVGATIIPNTLPGQVAPQHAPGGALHYQHPSVQVQTQYPPGQKRVYNIDRRPPKTSELYNPEMLGLQGSPTGSPMGQMSVAYGDPVGVMQVDRSQYTQFAQQRFGQAPVISGQAIQYPQHTKPKAKQFYKKSQSPRGQQEQGLVKRQGSKSSDTEGAQGSVLEVYDLPTGIKNYEADVLFEDLKSAGARIHWPNDNPNFRQSLVRAVFSCPSAAEQALSLVNSPNFKLRFPGSRGSTDANSTVPMNP